MIQENYEVVVSVFKKDDDVRGKCIGMKSLYFASINEIIRWADDSGVDFSR